jgi:hypothetical protein
MRFDVDTGRLAAQRAGQTPHNARPVSDGGLYVTHERPGERVGRMMRGKRLWERPVLDVFGAGRSSDRGWGISYDKRAGVYAGSLGQPPDDQLLAAYQAGRAISLDLSDELLVGFKAEDGTRLWHRRGATDCIVDGHAEGIVPVRCVIGGTLTLQEGEEPIARRPRVRVEGYEPSTGKVTWSLWLSPRAARGFVEDGDRLWLSRDAATMLVPTDAGVLRVTVADGAADRVTDDERLLCSTGLVEIAYLDHRRNGGYLSRACRPDGRPARGAPRWEPCGTPASLPATSRWWRPRGARRRTPWRLRRREPLACCLRRPSRYASE